MISNRTPKAYKNLEFLSSPEARSIRLLSEFLEPLRRFRREGIRDTIVFFGSARILSERLAKKQLNEAKRKLKTVAHPGTALKRMLEVAKINYEMSSYYEDASQLTYQLTQWSMNLVNDTRFVVCSGGGPGIMEAANKGAMKAGGKSIGLNISLPFEQSSNPFVSKGLNFEFHYFFMRKFWFVYPAKALVMFPGGFGTLDEMMEVLTLLQTKKIKKDLTVVLYGRKYWNQVINFEAMVKYGTISLSDLKLFKFADTPDEAFKILKHELTKNYLRGKNRVHIKRGNAIR